MIENNAWVDKFAPTNLDECLLPGSTRKYLNELVQEKNLPNMGFYGPPGIGKTSTAKAIAKQLDCEFMIINASKHGNIDTIRTDIQQFASTIAFDGNKKILLLDESDGLTAAAQNSLRGTIDEFSSNVTFILTANFTNKIIEPLHSRLTTVDFLFQRGELPELAKGLFKFLLARLEESNCEYDKGAVQQFLKTNLTKTTDIRKILINAQKICKTGVFNNDSLIDIDKERLDHLIETIKSKNFNEMRKWVGENSDIEMSEIVRFTYNNVKDVASGPQIPLIVSIINEYQYKHAFVADKEINTVCMLAEISAAL